MNVADLLNKLKSLPSNTYLDDPELSAICRELIPSGFDPANIKGVIETIKNFVDQGLLVDEDVEEISSEYNKSKQTVEEETGSKSLNSQELKELLRQLDEHENKVGKEKSSKENIRDQIQQLIKRNSSLGKIKIEDLEKIIIKRREIELEEVKKGRTLVEAEDLAEEKILVAQEIEEIAPDLEKGKVDKIAEEIVDKGETDEEKLIELKDQVVEEKKLGVEIDKLADEIINTIKTEVDDLSKNDEEIITQLIKKRVEEVVKDPFKKILDPEIVINEKGERVVGENLVDKVIKTYGRTLSPSQETQVTMALSKKAEVGVDKIHKENGASASAALIREKRGELFARGINPGEIRSILALRYSQNSVAEDTRAIEVLKENKHSDGKHETAAGRADVVRQFFKSSESVAKNVENVLKVADKLKGVKGFEPLVDVSKSLSENPKLTQGMEMIRKLVQFQDKINGFTGNSLTQIGRILKIEGLESFGQSLLTRFGGEIGGAMATHLAEFGLENGLKSIFGHLLSTGTVTAVQAGTVAVAEGTALIAGEAALAGAAVATGPPGWVIGLIIMAAQFVFGLVKNFFGKIKDKLLGWLEDAGLISKDFVNSLGDGVKKIGLGIMAGLGVIATAFLGIPAMLAGAVGIVGPALAITIVALLGYNMYQTASTQISPLVINKDVSSGVCIPIEDPGTSNAGGINCNVNAPVTNAINVTKANFVNVAERWRSGGGVNAEKCFNDVVCKAKTAGINPDYALWAWLHESGASNYKGFPSVSDFGIIYVPKNDFTAQIDAFLKLDPASGCMGKNGITDYWLAFAANYLNGTDNCDPDFLNVSSNITPRQYLAELKSTWGWINSAPMPSSIHITPEKCGGGTDNSTIKVGPDGKKYLCEPGAPGNIGESPYNPNTPGLPGTVVPGECSVSSKVVLTKQCDSQWASKPLPQGGTICQAGCGPTSVSMMLRSVNGSWTPDAVIYAPGSAYSSMGGGGSSLDQAYLTLVSKFGGGAVTLNGTTRSCDEKTIGAWICAGKVVMVLEDAYTKSGTGGHFVLGVAVQNGNIITADPYYNVSTPFDGKKEYGHAAAIRGCLTVDAAAIK